MKVRESLETLGLFVAAGRMGVGTGQPDPRARLVQIRMAHSSQPYSVKNPDY